MEKLAEKKCIPCSGETPPLSPDERNQLMGDLGPGWIFTNNDTRIAKSYSFKDFKGSMDLAIAIGELAEEQFHHPELNVGWGHLEVEIWTHKIGDLVESDFILAAKIDQLG